MALSKQERLDMFCQRLKDSPAAADAEEAFDQIQSILNEVEDEHSGIVYNPETWMSDGRLPPQMDSVRSAGGRPDIRRFRSRHHNTFIGANGAIEIQLAIDGTVVTSKAGADGRMVWNQSGAEK